MNSTLTSFKELDPDVILNATETSGFRTTGELSQLNSYENRVFAVGIEDGLKESTTSSGHNPREQIIIKFYRPGRWSADCILEEHSFLNELTDADLKVAPALKLQSGPHRGSTLGQMEGMYYSVFPKVRGRLPDEFDEAKLKRLGRILGQLHNVGARTKFRHRPVLNHRPFSLWENLDLLADQVSVELWSRYEAAALAIIENYEELIDPASYQRIHGDFHRGNTLLEEESFRLVDFDDSCMGPAVQDFWMLFSSDESTEEAHQVIEGYSEFRKFPLEQLTWIPALRGARIISYAAWITRRWTDPSFSKLFPDYGTHKYWSVETEALERIVYGHINRY